MSTIPRNSAKNITAKKLIPVKSKYRNKNGSYSPISTRKTSTLTPNQKWYHENCSKDHKCKTPFEAKETDK
jgi:hypothetical protein